MNAPTNMPFRWQPNEGNNCYMRLLLTNLIARDSVYFFRSNACTSGALASVLDSHARYRCSRLVMRSALNKYSAYHQQHII